MKKVCVLLFALMLLACSALAETVVTTQAFTDAAVKQEDLEAIVNAGFSTASAINQQPWFFAVVTNKEVMAEISSGGMMPPSGMTPPAGADVPAKDAPSGMPPAGASGAKASVGDSPVAIVIYMDSSSKSPDPHFDCGLACQNMVNAANALGYGTKIVSAPTMTLNGDRHDEICGLLNVDTSLSAVAVLLIGYRDVDVETSPTTRDTAKVSYTN
ncbi:MAG: nitroreductase family protein [Clostridia bacterium]|nr:nitroreductase family protein [Clostridia bacterium]